MSRLRVGIGKKSYRALDFFERWKIFIFCDGPWSRRGPAVSVGSECPESAESRSVHPKSRIRAARGSVKFVRVFQPFCRLLRNVLCVALCPGRGLDNNGAHSTVLPRPPEARINGAE